MKISMNLLILVLIYSLSGCTGTGKKELIKLIESNQTIRKYMASWDSSEIVEIEKRMNDLTEHNQFRREYRLKDEIVETDSLMQLDSVELQMIRNRLDSIKNEIRLPNNKLIRIKNNELKVWAELRNELESEKRIQHDLQYRKNTAENKSIEALNRVKKFEIETKEAEMALDSALKGQQETQKQLEEFEIQK